jgi:ABC-type transport system substrate-binding protein
MAKSRYPHGFHTKFLVYAPDLLINEALAPQLKPIGIVVGKLQAAPDAAYIAAETGNKNKTPFSIQDAGCASPDPGQCYDYLFGKKNIAPGGWNVANWDPPDVETMLKQGFAAPTPAKRLTVYKKLLTRINTDLPYIAVFDVSSPLALSRRFAWPSFRQLNGFWYDAGPMTNLIKPA